MMAVDTNLLVYAHRQDSKFHGEALSVLLELSNGAQRWGIPWPCVHEFIAIVTHPRIYQLPTPLGLALDCIEQWIESPLCHLIGEGPSYWDRLKKLASQGKVAGPMIHDARVAALCLDNGVTLFLSADRDFSRFPSLKTKNPLPRAVKG